MNRVRHAYLEREPDLDPQEDSAFGLAAMGGAEVVSASLMTDLSVASRRSLR
jgi:hypothetical protein